MAVFRLTPLPEAANRGRLIVPVSVAVQTRIALQGFAGPDGRHEGMLFWIGRRLAPDVLVSGAVVPDCQHSAQRVIASPESVGAVARRSRELGLGVVAQVHSHPGSDTRHSSGDDGLILMPFEGMFSLVVGRYGEGGITPSNGAGLHQFLDGRWVRIPASYDEALTIVPTLLGGLG